MVTKREKIIFSIISEVIQDTLKERLSDRVQDVSGLNHAYANKIAVAPVLSVQSTNKDQIDLNKFETERFKVQRFLGLARSVDGKSIGIAELPGGVRIYVDLINLREVAPLNENDLASRLARLKDGATLEQISKTNGFIKAGYKFSDFIEGKITDDKQSRVLLYKKWPGKGREDIWILPNGQAFKQTTPTPR